MAVMAAAAAKEMKAMKGVLEHAAGSSGDAEAAAVAAARLAGRMTSVMKDISTTYEAAVAGAEAKQVQIARSFAEHVAEALA